MTAYHDAHERLVDIARTELLHRAQDLPEPGISEVDQVLAATRDAHRIAASVGRHADLNPLPDARRIEDLLARTFVSQATAATEPTVCQHIREVPDQPTLVDLERCLVACMPCVMRPEPTGPVVSDEDECDWCHEHDHKHFRFVALQLGPMLSSGNACDQCWESIQDANSPDQPGE